MRRRRVQRSETRGQGVGRWCHCFGKYADSPSTWKWEGCLFGFLHPETRFQKSAFSGAAFSGSVWRVGQNDAVCVCFRKRAFSCGWPLSFMSMDTPLWRYTVPVCNEICRKLLFKNLSILLNSKIVLITFCQESPRMLCEKFGARL